MSRLIPILVRLYPPDWRARYEQELVSLLADTVLKPSAVLDIALGALDARLSRDYPSEAGADRKVRRPMLSRLAPLAIVLGGVFLAMFIAVFLAVGSPEGPDSSGLMLLAFYVVPIAVGLMAIGIAGIALGRLGRDPVARALGLLASAFGLALAAAIFALFFVGDVAWATLSLLIPAFALASGLLGLRMLTAGPEARLKGVLLTAGLVAAFAWTIGWYLSESSATSSAQEMAALVQTLAFGGATACPRPGGSPRPSASQPGRRPAVADPVRSARRVMETGGL
jgi:hypothetical protein